MPDREKVIKGLEMCIKDIECTGCPYEGECFDAIDDRQFGESMMRDALSLLKEQEAVKPTWGRGKPFCGACGLRIHGGKFCSECGKPIAWEGR